MKKIALLQKASPREAEELVQLWGPKHHGGIPGLMVAVAKREAAKAVCEMRGNVFVLGNVANFSWFGESSSGILSSVFS